MADALVSMTLEKLASFLQQKVTLMVDSHEELTKLSATFRTIRGVLNDAEQKQVKDELVKIWLEDLKDIAYEIEDLLDEWSTEILRSQLEGDVDNARLGKRKVSSYLSSAFSFSTNNIGYRLKEIRERLVWIASQKDMFNFIEGVKNEQPERLMTSSLIDISEICGRSLDKDIITSKLLSQTCQQEIGLPIVSIVGMGGFGKTTLAQLVFNDHNVKNHFKNRMWVCVSEPFDKVRLAKAIIEAIGECVPNVIEWEALQHHLYKSIEGKHFLLVLDDVWTEDDTKWNPLKLSLHGGAKESRILVTTRNERVAIMMGTTYTHYLEQLSKHDSWSLFSRIAFAGRREEEREKLEEIGKEIAMKCKGVPLAAKTIGSLMRFKRTKQDWQNVLESETWELPEFEKGVLPALLLSYYDLPSQLKSCFAYCAIFPKDHDIEKDMLIKLWMAQGFFITTGKRELEIIGGEYFDNLVMRSFFQDFKKDGDGNITRCKMHDLVHDLAQFLTKTECFIMEINNAEMNYKKTGRHLTLTVNDTNIDSIPSSIYNLKNLRTFQLFGWWHKLARAPPDLFHRLTCLRALDLSCCCLENLPSGVEKLIHLRYLDLSRTKLKELPEMVSSLFNLQTLKLNWCRSLCKLPVGMGKMSNLRHIEIESTNELRYLPQRIGRLTSLRTLCKFIVGGVSRGCKIGELKDLNLLKGKLRISGLGRLANVDEANGAKLKNKQHLRILTLDFQPNELKNVGESEVEMMGDVLESLQPHPNLEELQIWNYLGFKFPSWIGDTVLSNLLSLALYNCRKCVELPALGKLPSLEVLSIKHMDEVKYIGLEFYGTNGGGGDNRVFPRLRELNIDGMDILEEWDTREGAEIMPRLQRLVLWKCPQLKVLPRYLPHTLRSLSIRRCPELNWMPSCPPQLLEELILFHDVGNLSRSLPVLPNLKSLSIFDSLHRSLPEGIGQLKALQILELRDCDSIMEMAEELQHLNTLRELRILMCPILGPRCRKEVGEDWSIISHIPNIYIEGVKIQ